MIARDARIRFTYVAAIHRARDISAFMLSTLACEREGIESDLSFDQNRVIA